MTRAESVFYVWFAVILMERVAELLLARRNRAASLASGGIEFGQEHFAAMIAMHVAFLISTFVEAFFRTPSWRQTLAMLLVSVLAQALRWWTIATLGKQWNISVIVVPGWQRVAAGPFRFLRHPNYLAVILEMISLPMMADAWFTALVFSIANIFFLTVRLRCENAALQRFLI